MERKNEEALFQNLQSLYQAKRYEEAAVECQRLIDTAQFYYYEILIIYLQVLLNLKKYEQAKTYLDAEFAMPYIPLAIERQLDEIAQRLSQELKLNQPFTKRLYDEEQLEILLNGDEVDQAMAVDYIESINHWELRDMLIRFLEESTADPILKTRVMYLLRQQGLKQAVVVTKNQKRYEFKEGMPLIEETEFYHLALEMIENAFEKQPSLKQMMDDYLDLFLSYEYPNIPLAKEVSLVIAMLYAQLMTIQKQAVDWSALEDQFKVKKAEVLSKISAF